MFSHGLNTLIFGTLLAAIGIGAMSGGFASSAFSQHENAIQTTWQSLLRAYDARVGALEATAKIDEVGKGMPTFSEEVLKLKRRVEALKIAESYDAVTPKALEAYDDVQKDVASIVVLFTRQVNVVSRSEDRPLIDLPKIKEACDAIATIEATIATQRGKLISEVDRYNRSIVDSMIAKRHGHNPKTPIYLGR